MWDDFKLTVSEPSTVRRVGKMDAVLDIAERLEEKVRFDDDSYLAMSARYTTDSSYLRLNDFFYPICVTVRRWKGQLKKKTVAMVEFTFWKRKSDSRCLVMFGFSNAPGNNFEGDYKEALDLILDKIKCTQATLPSSV